MSEEGNICAITWIWIWKRLFECLWEVNISVNIREFPFTEHYRTYFSFLLFFLYSFLLLLYIYIFYIFLCAVNATNLILWTMLGFIVTDIFYPHLYIWVNSCSYNIIVCFLLRWTTSLAFWVWLYMSDHVSESLLLIVHLVFLWIVGIWIWLLW